MDWGGGGGSVFYPLLRNYPSEGFLNEVTAELAQFMPYFLLKLLSCLYIREGRLACLRRSQLD